MAKIVLRNGTDGARTKIITVLKNELQQAILYTTASVTAGNTLTNLQIQSNSSDGTTRKRTLQFTSSSTVFQTQNNVGQTNDNLITLFYLRNGRNVNKIILGKEDGTGFYVGAYITFPTITPTQDTAHYIREIKIEVLDQA